MHISERKKKSKFFLSLFFVLVLAGCGFFKVDKLTPHLLAKIPLNNMNGLMWPVQKGIVYEMPMRVAFSEPYLIASEPSEQRVKIFKDNQPFIFISSVKKNRLEQDKNHPNNNSSLNSGQQQKTAEELSSLSQDFIKTEVKSVINGFLDIPEKIVAGKQKDFYVVNYVRAGSIENEESQGYFKILHFTLEGEYLGVLGRGGQVDLPFESIAWLDVDNDGKLWVFYQHMGEYILDAYEDSHVVYSVDNNQCISILFSSETQNQKNTLFTCEKMMPFSGGKRVIFFGKAESVAKGEDEKESSTFYRKLTYFDMEKKESFDIFNDFTEANEYLALAFSDFVYMWNPVDAERLRVSVYDLEGSKHTNLQPELLGRRALWKNIYYGLDGSLYGTRILNNQFELYGWK